MAEWRDTTNDNLIRVAELKLQSIGQPVEVVNLAEAGTGVPHYIGNLMRYGVIVDPDLIVVALYVGNDLKPGPESVTAKAEIQPSQTVNAFPGREKETGRPSSKVMGSPSAPSISLDERVWEIS